MRKKFFIIAMLFLVVSGLMFTASCAQRTSTLPSSSGDYSRMAEEEQTSSREMAAATPQPTMEEEISEAELAESAAMEKAKRDNFINENIHFEFDSAVLLPRAREILKTKAEWLQENQNVTVTIQGHCDERGTNEYNMALGDSRARAAKMFIVDLGIASSRITTVSFGEERPVDPGHNEAAWAKNRRANFVIMNE